MVAFKFESGKDQEQDQKTASRGAEAQSVIKEVDEVIAGASGKGATHIHIDPLPEGLAIRLRVDNELHELKVLPDALKSNVVNRIKVLSGMDITRALKVQRGYFKVVQDEKKIEMYTYSFPSSLGEKMVIKIQTKTQVSITLDQLGMIPQMTQNLKTTLARGSGLVLVAGPPGNGKQTTVYAALNFLSKPELLVMSYEPMLKYDLPGIVQGKPDDRGETSFSEGVRGMFLQDPDLAFVGDVQDLDVARESIQASFAKRIVFARLNASDTVNAIFSFIDLGVPPFLVASAVTGVVGQRLCRRLCDSCKEKYEPSDNLLQEIGFKLAPGSVFFSAKGCDACNKTGYNGYIGMYEYYQAKEELSELIVGKANAREVRQKAMELGMAPMKRDGIQKALSGWTSVEEVLNKL